MHLAMHKPRELPFKWFVAHFTELDNYLPLFTGLSASKNIPPEELNNILLHTIPNDWKKQAYLQGWDFDTKVYKATCDLFKRM